MDYSEKRHTFVKMERTKAIERMRGICSRKECCRQEIAAGESVSLVLITEVPEGTEIEKAELIMRNGSGRAVMLLK